MDSVAFLLAQHTEHTGHGAHGSQTGELVMTIGITVMLALTWVALGVVCWIFWRAKKREDEALREAEVKWRNAPLS
jgi:heme/copper-type cytochrome/quinol oxidase subunit 2